MSECLKLIIVLLKMKCLVFVYICITLSLYIVESKKIEKTIDKKIEKVNTKKTEQPCLNMCAACQKSLVAVKIRNIQVCDENMCPTVVRHIL